MYEPFISIVIPAYNAERWIGDAIGSSLRQRYNSFEVIVIDDGSTDETYSVALRYVDASGGTVQVLRTVNEGSSAARNAGLASAKGKYVLFLDADDILNDGALEFLGPIAAQTNTDAVFGTFGNFDELSGQENLAVRKIMYRDSYANVARLLYVQGSFLLRKTDLRWNEQRVIWEGMEYLLDFLAPGREATFTDFVVVKARQHQSPNRKSCRFDHFEPAMTGRFFAAQKAKLRNSKRLNFERESALDFHILGNAYALVRADRFSEADELLREISWSNVMKYDWCHVGSLPWVAHWAGPRLGTRAFYYVNKLIGRA